MEPSYSRFADSVLQFRAVERGASPQMTSFRRYIKRIRHCKAANDYWARHPEATIVRTNVGLKPRNKEIYHRFFMDHSDEVLSAQGAELDALAEHFDVDQSLPTMEKQEQVFQSMAETYIHGDPHWTEKEIERQKKHFIQTIEKTHFVSLTCQLLQLNESVVRTWIRTDPEFSKKVLQAQTRFGERVAHSMLVKAIEGDNAAAMYVLKQFEGSVNFIDPEVEQSTISTVDGLDVSALSAEEQETLLRLMRKAQGTLPAQSTEFVEFDEPSNQSDSNTSLGTEGQKFIEGDDDDSEPPVVPIAFCGD